MAHSPRAVNYTLTDKAIQAAKPKDKPYPLSDGGGLFIEVLPSGAKAWRYSYGFNGKRTKVTIGTYPTISIKAARNAHEGLRCTRSDGIDPARKKQLDRLARKSEVAKTQTFETFARVWFAEKMAHATARTQKQNLGWMVNDVFPQIGAIPLAEVHASDVLKLLEGMRNTPTKATNVQCILDRVYQYAAQKLLVTYNPATPMKGLIAKPKATSYRPLSVAEIGPFVEALRTCNAHPGTRLAVEFLMLTAVRKDNTCKARWAHIDVNQRTWTIPGRTVGANGFMKMPEAHTVYLSDQALVLLDRARELSASSEWVFPSVFSRSTPMAECSINHLLSRLKAAGSCPSDFAPHGLRSTFSTMCNEGGIVPDVVEECLAHRERSSVRAIYNRATHADQCKAAMQWYADHLDQIVKGADVIKFKAA